MGAAAAYMMEEMRIRLNSGQLKAETWAELGNINIENENIAIASF